MGVPKGKNSIRVPNPKTRSTQKNMQEPENFFRGSTPPLATRGSMDMNVSSFFRSSFYWFLLEGRVVRQLPPASSLVMPPEPRRPRRPRRPSSSSSSCSTATRDPQCSLPDLNLHPRPVFPAKWTLNHDQRPVFPAGPQPRP